MTLKLIMHSILPKWTTNTKCDKIFSRKRRTEFCLVKRVSAELNTIVGLQMYRTNFERYQATERKTRQWLGHMCYVIKQRSLFFNLPICCFNQKQISLHMLVLKLKVFHPYMLEFAASMLSHFSAPNYTIETFLTICVCRCQVASGYNLYKIF